MTHSMLHSAIYEGEVEHHRLSPKPHRFTYSMFMVYLDLNELDHVFSKRWFWSTKRLAPARFCRRDYLDPSTPSLDTAVRNLVQQRTGHWYDGPIRMLTHLRYFGFVFNPVTFYYLFDAEDTSVQCIVAEITNTPWNERHAYVLVPGTQGGKRNALRFRFDKQFHVSPFMPMHLQYDWAFSEPDQALSVCMKNYEAQSLCFVAKLKLQRSAISSGNLASVLCRFPWMTLKVIVAIYYEALRLKLKKLPFFAHPNHQRPATSEETSL
ncbi:MAG: DUF1365 domain-containing protein [Myxococcales bacterium]|nr:MAG: DUF1365 domain-containing protein [Myxococcales bacterium]